MSKYIHTSAYKRGMILSSSVINKYGQTLLKKNSELKDAHKDLFDLWEIKYIYVENDSENCAETTDADLYQFAKNKLDSILTWTPETDIEKNLYETALKHLANSL
ncbi:MAG TPA: hypothetical protein VHO28_09490 [Ignavibacteriales bacterium]|nr:hypothetical protein [Ignavibacteriales bacterium]